MLKIKEEDGRSKSRVNYRKNKIQESDPFKLDALDLKERENVIEMMYELPIKSYRATIKEH